MAETVSPNAAHVVILQLARDGALSEHHVVRANETEYRLFNECFAAGWIMHEAASHYFALTDAGRAALEAGDAR